MAESDKLREVVERTVAETVDAQAAALRRALTERIWERIKSTEPAKVPGAASTALLNAAITAIQEGSTQAEILTALLDGAADFAGRAALFVLRSGVASGWRARGFSSSDIRGFSLDVVSGLAARALQLRVSATGSASEFDSSFIGTLGAPLQGSRVLVLPLLVRDKVAALLYADCGSAAPDKLDANALETLVRITGVWLELVSLRKGAPMTAPEPPPGERAPVTRPYLDEAPVMQSAAIASLGSSRSVRELIAETPVAEVTYQTAAVAEPAEPAEPAELPALSPEEEEIHRKARRFAKLLVDEIKLYNQKKVEEGRRHRDLYARLKDEIQKSRATYDKRYGQTVAASADYFRRELIRILADNNPTLMGSEDSQESELN